VFIYVVCIVTQFDSLCNGINSMSSTWVLNASPKIQGGKEAGIGEKGVACEEDEPRMEPHVIDSWRIPLWPIEGICPLLKCQRYCDTSELP